MQEIREEVDKISVSTIKIDGQLKAAFDIRGIAAFTAATQEVDRFIAEGAAAAERLNLAVNEVGSTQLRPLITAAETLAGRFNEATGYNDNLIKQTKESLVAAINSAKLAMDQFTESQKDSLQSLKESLQDLKAEGNAIKQAELDYQRNLSDINDRINIAKAHGNKEALAALNEEREVLKQIYDITVSRIKAEEDSQSNSENTTKLEQSLTSISSITFDTPVKGIQALFNLLVQLEEQSARSAAALRAIDEAI